MLIERSNLIGLPIFELENQSRVAELVDFFINEENLKIEALFAKNLGFLHQKKLVSEKEITEISKVAVIIQNEESLVDPRELVRLEKKIKNRAKIIGEKVYTKKGEFLGTVFDFVIESSSLTLNRLYLKKLFDHRIIHSSAIVKIEQHKITVKDNFEMVKPEVVPMGKTELA